MIQYPLSPQGFPPLAQNGSGDEVGAALHRRLPAAARRDRHPGRPDLPRPRGACRSSAATRCSGWTRPIESFANAAVAHMDEIATEVGRARAKSLEFVVGLRRRARPTSSTSATSCAPREPAARRRGRPGRGVRGAGGVGQRPGRSAGRPSRRPASTSSCRPTRAGSATTSTDGTAPKGWGEFVRAFLEEGVGGRPSGGGVDFVDDEAKVLRRRRHRHQDRRRSSPRGRPPRSPARRRRSTPRSAARTDALAVALPAYVNAGGEGQVQGVWNYALTTLSDGGRSIPVVRGLPGPVRRPRRVVPGAVHLTRGRHLGRRGPGAAEQRGPDRERRRWST